MARQPRVHIKFEGDSLEELGNKFADMLPAVRSGMTKLALILERKVVENLSGPILKVRSGRLRSSITHLIQVVGRGRHSDVHVQVGSNVIYLGAHEFGTVILPKTAKFLTIPMPGVTGEARDYDNTFVAKNMIFQKIGKNQIRPLFALRQRVVIPSRKPLRRSWQQASPQAINALTDTIDEYLKPTKKIGVMSRWATTRKIT